MSIPVWTFKTHYPMDVTLEYEEEWIHCGPGIDKSVQHEIAFVNYDLTGQSISRIGTAVFRVKCNTRNYSGTFEFKSILQFLQARKLAGNESFYFYNPVELATPDPTGASAVGRYLVKFVSSLGWTLKMASLNDFVTLTFKEDRS